MNPPVILSNPLIVVVMNELVLRVKYIYIKWTGKLLYLRTFVVITKNEFVVTKKFFLITKNRLLFTNFSFYYYYLIK